MKNVLVALPADARPAACQVAQAMVAAGGWTLNLPAADALSSPHKLARRDQLASWLEREAHGSAGVLVSIDTLVYGGALGAREILDDVHSLLPRLLLLQRLKWRQRRRPLYVFSSLLQIVDREGAGKNLAAWSFYSDKARETRDPSAATLADRAEMQLPAEVRNRHLALRARNRAVNLALLDLVDAGVIDHLCFTLADEVGFGLEVAEMRELEDQIAARGLGARVELRTGDDEAMCTLAAHLVAGLRERLRARSPLAMRANLRIPCGPEWREASWGFSDEWVAALERDP